MLSDADLLCAAKSFAIISTVMIRGRCVFTCVSQISALYLGSLSRLDACKLARSMQYLCRVITAGLFYKATQVRKEFRERPSQQIDRCPLFSNDRLKVPAFSTF
eukprot:10914-Heterococcus_DN1.PRE.2